MANNPIRVGMIRCDSHAMFYGVLMDEADPDRIRVPQPATSKLSDGWWPNGAIHRFFYTRPADPTNMTIGRVDGFQITRLWDEDRRTAEVFAHVFNDRPRVCDSLDQVSDEVDLVFIADCNFDGSDHIELASPGLNKGVPTFVDKPFGGTSANGRKLAELAQAHGAPICTGSILSAMPATDQFESRFAEFGDVHHLSIEGCGSSTAGLIHAIALAQRLFGTKIVGVRALVGTSQTYILLDYGGPPVVGGVGIVCNCGGPYSGMYAHAFGEGGCVEAVFNDFKYAFGAKRIVERIRDMVRSGATPRRDVDDMLAALQTLDAVRAALDQGTD